MADRLSDQTVSLEAVSFDVHSGHDDEPVAVMKEWEKAIPAV
jgi:hypothetical protein